MPNRMALHPSKVDDDFLKQFCLTYGIGPEYNPTTPQPNHCITDCPKGYIGVYTQHFESANIRLPFSLFFLDFLKQHKLNISQLSPNGAMKVTHFEIVCRALGGEPSLPLFSQFFKLVLYGDWYTVCQRKRPVLGCLSWVPDKCALPWKDYFFWVSADASVPFKMDWREHGEPLNVVTPSTESFDEKLYHRLVNNPTPLQPFPEHVLVMAGLSRNWPNLKAEPVIKDGDEEMDLLKYIKKKGVGNAGVMKLTLRSLAEHEDPILERTKGICYQGTKKRKNVEVITIDDSPVQSCDETTPHTGNTPVVEADVEAPLSAGNRRRRREKQIVFTDESSSDNYEVGQTSTGQEYVPKSVPEVVTGWYERKAKMEARLRERISRYRLTMSCQHKKIRKLQKKVRKLKKSSNIAKGGKAKLVDEARNMQEKLKQVNGMLDEERTQAAREKDGWMQERKSLEKSLEQVVSERQWLIEEGFQHVIKKLHGSREFLEQLGAVESNLWASAAHDGLVEGYANCKAGVALEHNRLYMPKAEGELIKAVHELKNMQYPYVVALSKCRDRTLNDLKAMEPDAGMEDAGAGCSNKARKAI